MAGSAGPGGAVRAPAHLRETEAPPGPRGRRRRPRPPGGTARRGDPRGSPRPRTAMPAPATPGASGRGSCGPRRPLAPLEPCSPRPRRGEKPGARARGEASRTPQRRAAAIPAARGAPRTIFPPAPGAAAAAAPTWAAAAAASEDEGRRRPHAPPLPQPPEIRLAGPSRPRLSFSARRRSGEGSVPDPPRPRRGRGRRADQAGARAERAGRSGAARARAPTERARGSPWPLRPAGSAPCASRPPRCGPAEPNCRGGPVSAALAAQRLPRGGPRGGAPGRGGLERGQVGPPLRPPPARTRPMCSDRAGVRPRRPAPHL